MRVSRAWRQDSAFRSLARQLLKSDALMRVLQHTRQSVAAMRSEVSRKRPVDGSPSWAY